MEVKEAKPASPAPASEVYHAVCWATGEIEFVLDIPEGAAVMASGPHDELVSFIGVTARHGYGGGEGKLFVPGVPEAANQSEGMDALMAHLAWIKKSAPEGVNVRAPKSRQNHG